MTPRIPPKGPCLWAVACHVFTLVLSFRPSTAIDTPGASMTDGPTRTATRHGPVSCPAGVWRRPLTNLHIPGVRVGRDRIVVSGSCGDAGSRLSLYPSAGEAGGRFRSSLSPEPDRSGTGEPDPERSAVEAARRSTTSPSASTSRVRDDQLDPPAHPRAALFRPTRLVQTVHHHPATPVNFRSAGKDRRR